MKTGRTATFSGRAAEEIAERLYAAEGCRVLARRWRCPEGEIDLVIEDVDGTIVFVEVKARGTLTSAAAAISRAQSRRLAASIHRWLAASGAEPGGLRVDVVLVDRAGRAERIPNAIAFDAE